MAKLRQEEQSNLHINTIASIVSLGGRYVKVTPSTFNTYKELSQQGDERGALNALFADTTDPSARIVIREMVAKTRTSGDATATIGTENYEHPSGLAHNQVTRIHAVANQGGSAQVSASINPVESDELVVKFAEEKSQQQPMSGLGYAFHVIKSFTIGDEANIGLTGNRRWPATRQQLGTLDTCHLVDNARTSAQQYAINDQVQQSREQGYNPIVPRVHKPESANIFRNLFNGWGRDGNFHLTRRSTKIGRGFGSSQQITLQQPKDERVAAIRLYAIKHAISIGEANYLHQSESEVPAGVTYQIGNKTVSEAQWHTHGGS